VIAVIDPLDRQRIERVIRCHVAARAFHQRAVLVRHVLAADGVEQHVDADARAAALGERLGHLARGVTLLIDEIGERDRRLCGANRRQHGRKDLVSVEEYLRAISAHELGVGVRLERAEERRLADGDVGCGVMRPRKRARAQRET
jgi:hypothetical protein